MVRVFGYWLLYATVGVVLLAMAIGGGGEIGPEDKTAPTRMRTKFLAACSGVALAVAILGAYLGSTTGSWWMFGVAAPASLVLIVWSWIAIAGDLRTHAQRRAGRGPR